MKIKFLGHASFFITSKMGTRLITDPYKAGAYDGGIGYSEINEPADIVTISHEHDDHNYVGSIRGKPEIVRDPAKRSIKDVKIEGFTVYHDKSQGRERGKNTIFVLEIDGLRIVHLGDLGHTLSEGDAKRLGRIDILFLPVGGFFTIDSTEARKVYELLKPRIVIPMHYKTDKCGFPIAQVDNFIKDMDNVKRIAGSEIEIVELPSSPVVYVLKPLK